MARVLVAPDSFKGTIPAPAVAAAIARGLESAGQGHETDICPVADGGEGTMDILINALGGTYREAAASDPLGRPITASYGVLTDDGRRVIVEMAQASGLSLVAENERDAEAASTYGTGELINAAIDAGGVEILVAAGGSATSDGGAGAIEAIEAAGGLRGAHITVLSDVTVPFEEAAAVFGPQKGADPEAVERLTARLEKLATTLPRDPRGIPRTGAAGGFAGGMWAMYGAEIVSGAFSVLKIIDFDSRLRWAELVVTGEGRIDSQSLQGKITGEIIERAAAKDKPVHVFVGNNGLTEAEIAGINGLADDGVIEAGTPEKLEAAGAALGQRLLS